jgi:hypothetical protein
MRFIHFNRIRRDAPTCPSCGREEWLPGGVEPTVVPVIPYAALPRDQLQFVIEGVTVTPVTCRFCGHEAADSVEHLERVYPEV